MRTMRDPISVSHMNPLHYLALETPLSGLLEKPQWNSYHPHVYAGKPSKRRLLQAQPNPRQMGAGNLHTSLQALSDSDRACISQCRTAHRYVLLLDRVCMFTSGIPAQHTWRALHVRMDNNKLVTWSCSE